MSAPKFKVGDRVKVNPKLLTHWIAEGYTTPRMVIGRILRIHHFLQGGYIKKTQPYGYIIELEDRRDGFRSLGFDEDELRKIRR